ncbi:MAG: sporulation integral membrane protein YtvI [Clostridia bacterium]|jgi:sporulation integral membrane protein YtvI|nr:sporulation integral membrane protein YtvI [Clostridia bacterium]MCI9413422.1 sporulation integral membrane protein YtvI [Clostridia bacterium]
MVIDMNYWGKVLKNIAVLALTILGVYLGLKLAIFYMPFLVAFIIALMLEPCIRFIMKKTKLKRKASSILVFVIAIITIVGLLIWAGVTIVSEASNLLTSLNEYFEKGYALVQDMLSKIDFNRLQIPENIMNTIQESAMEFLGTLTEWAKNALTGAINFLTSIPTIGVYTVITLLSLYFMCVDKVYMIDQLEHHLPQTWVKKIGVHLKGLVKSLGGYLKAELTLVLISFIISVIGLYIFHFVGLNVEYPLLMALIIGFVDLLPIFGSGTFMVPWAIISACTGDFSLAIAILVLWAIMSIVRQMIEPKIVSRTYWNSSNFYTDCHVYRFQIYRCIRNDYRPNIINCFEKYICYIY